MLKILIVEGNVKELREKAVKEGSLTQSDLYQKILQSLADDLVCTIIYPADAEAVLPKQSDLSNYDGIVWTGSALNIYERGPEVERQIVFMKQCFGEKTQIFGSCWGLQVAVVAAGGEVAANTKGREIGVARNIQTTRAGDNHPLYKGKKQNFDAVCIHQDHVVNLPKEAKILSSNAMSEVQAIEMKMGKSLFWGVQYHPEFDLEYIAGLIRRYGSSLVKEGICQNEGDVEKWAADLVLMQSNDGGNDLERRYSLGPDVLDSGTRLLELSNWLDFIRKANDYTIATHNN